MRNSEAPSGVVLDRPQPQSASNRPDDAPFGRDLARPVDRPVRPVEVREARRAIDGDVVPAKPALGRDEVLQQVATVAGYATGGAVLFQLGAWVLAGA